MKARVRELRGTAELLAAEDLQFLVWGGSERDIFPRDAMRALEHIGGLVAGAFSSDAGELVGLVVGLPTAQSHVQHSHLLAVHPAWRGTGLAVKLKQFQAEWGRERGITQIEWTYDPLRAINAQLNIHRLGAFATTYIDDFYGEMGGINAGIASDRLVAVWTPGSLPARPPQDAELPAINDPRTGDWRPGAEEAPAVLLHIPADLPGLLDEHPEQAVTWRQQTRGAFHALFGRGYRVCDFRRGAQPAYVLTAG
ncbi:GNAT family N-acetyltransferase [Deinococcus radiodurans]|jgi:Uncharacterized conserved protein|nr:GNAT family N-acetyltransferase [Deinococcus radiodurans]QIP30660.1 GNAT family N-acetyltransferase [Deinococcus radiodurans]UID72016.1 hypothetical protein DRO_B0082 [Deinococcus radiodurans R1 = ATCC 13939 = DSM 20539]UTA52494.1 GNAT family N-acetyltransferase [Deinococcus radiodurans]